MNILILTLPLFGLAITFLPIVPVLTNNKKSISIKQRLTIHLIMFFALLILTTIVLFSTGFVAHAMEMAGRLKPSPATKGVLGDSGFKFLGAAGSTGLGCIGGGLAVGGAAPAAIASSSENPDNFGKSMIFVVLGEGIAIYGLVVSFLILFAN